MLQHIKNLFTQSINLSTGGEESQIFDTFVLNNQITALTNKTVGL